MNKDCAGNFGLRDQIAALQWVYENIHNFGGDKRQITVTGESAGAASASLIAVSPLAKGIKNANYKIYKHNWKEYMLGYIVVAV